MKENSYIETEIGRIPREWATEGITSIVLPQKSSIKIGPFGSQLKKEFLRNNGEYKVYGQENVYSKDFDYCYRYLTEDRFKALQSCEIVPGDFLISTMGTVGKCAVVPPSIVKGIMDSHLLRLRLKSSINKDWFAFFFSSSIVQKQISLLSVGGIMDGLSSKIIKSIQVAHPNNYSEQTRIANALSSIDNLISSLDKLIEKKKNIKQGTMQQLLTGKKRLKGFSESWIEKKLGLIGITYSGLTGKTKEDFGTGNAKYITFLNVLNNPILNPKQFEYVVIKDGERQNNCRCGDIFFNTSSETPEEVGICAMLDTSMDNLYLNSFCFGYRLTDSNVVPEYLAYYFRSDEGRKLMTVLAQGVTRYNMSKSAFNNAKILMPSNASEQKAITDVLISMDKEIASLKLKKAKYESVKQGMMQQLLTGKIRLV